MLSRRNAGKIFGDDVNPVAFVNGISREFLHFIAVNNHVAALFYLYLQACDSSSTWANDIKI